MDKRKFPIQEILSFLGHFYKLKDVERTGWKHKLLLDNPESVAEHTLTMIVLALIFSEFNNFTQAKTINMIKMALIHDLGESVIGDYVPESIEIEKKKKLENFAINNILSKIPNTTIKKKYIKLWNEFDENKSNTSNLIHFIDKLEMAIQAKYYLDNNKNINKEDVKPFFDSALRYITDSYKVKDNTHIQNIDEIQQILLYLLNK
jgi:putative hydrolases of HD superfamily